MLKRLIHLTTSELTLWIAGLLVLYAIGGDHGLGTVCMFSWFGVDHCWGCGLGRALHEAMHLEFTRSIDQHPLGIPVLIILLLRIFQLAIPRTQTKPPWTSNS